MRLVLLVGEVDDLDRALVTATLAPPHAKAGIGGEVGVCGAMETGIQNVLPERVVGVVHRRAAEEPGAGVVHAGAEPVRRGQVDFTNVEVGVGHALPGVVGKEAGFRIQRRINAQFQTRVLHGAEVQVREAAREPDPGPIQAAPDGRRREWAKAGEPGRRLGDAPLTRLREEDLLGELVVVPRGRHRHPVVERSRVADFERVHTLFGQVRVTGHSGGHAVDGRTKGGVHQPQRQGVGDRHVEVVVDHRRRAERAVERHAERLVRTRLDQHGHTRRDDRVVNRRELVHARTRHEAQVLVDEDFILHVDAAFGARRFSRRNRQVELVVAEVAAIGEHMTAAKRRRVAYLKVVGLGVEQEVDPVAPRVDR